MAGLGPLRVKLMRRNINGFFIPTGLGLNLDDMMRMLHRFSHYLNGEYILESSE
jgi:hypothetical protein